MHCIVSMVVVCLKVRVSACFGLQETFGLVATARHGSWRLAWLVVDVAGDTAEGFGLAGNCFALERGKALKAFEAVGCDAFRLLLFQQLRPPSEPFELSEDGYPSFLSEQRLLAERSLKVELPKPVPRPLAFSSGGWEL